MTGRRVAYLGPPSSYTHQATVDNFDPEHWELKAQGTIADVFAAVQSESVTFGVVPFENSSNGAVVQTLDLLADRAGQYSDVFVFGETFVAVHHCLLGYSDGTSEDPESGEATPTRQMPSPVRSKVKPRKRVQHIKRVMSHPQALGQCEAFLSAHLRGAERQEVSSTSRAAQMVADDPSRSSAAIASRMAAQVHGLEILAASIEDRPDNETRFLVLKRGEGAPTDMEPPLPTFLYEAGEHTLADSNHDGSSGVAAAAAAAVDFARSNELHTENEQRHRNGSASPDLQPNPDWRTLVSFTINHVETGALSRVLNLFRDTGLNLTSINSRPTRGRPWHYVFFVEFDGRRLAKDASAADGGGCKVEAALGRLESVTEEHRWHGSWRKRGGI